MTTKNRGEIWLVKIPHLRGAELKKPRPAVIVNDNGVGVLNLRIIVPFTGWQESFDSKSWLIEIVPDRQNNLRKKSAADTFQVKSINANFLKHKIGELDQETMKKIELGLLKSLGIL